MRLVEIAGLGYIAPHRVDTGYRRSSFELGAGRVHLDYHTSYLSQSSFMTIIAILIVT
jgi:hypothetical protein